MRIRRLPSMREKKRYVTFRIESQKPVSYAEMKGAVTDSALGWMGEKGYSVSGLRVIRNLWKDGSQEGWISCAPAAVDDIKVALALVHQIGDSRVIFRTVKVSGTIKSGKEKLGG